MTSLADQIIAAAKAQAAGSPLDPEGAEPPTTAHARADELRARLVDEDGLRAIPPPEPLIDGWLYRDSLAWLHAKPGGGKTFIAVDLACCIATGTSWHGFKTTTGPVLYLIAEGASGLSQRVDAWKLGHGTEHIDTIKYLPLAWQMMDPANVAAFAEVAAELAPALIIIDTQARVTVGAVENDSRDMSRFVDALDRIRLATRACVLSVHHDPRNGDNPRGHTSLEGAATSILHATKDGDLLTIENTKQKDTPEQHDLRLALNPIGASATLSLATGSTTTDSERKLLTLIHGFGTPGVSSSELEKATDIPRRSLYRARSDLEVKGLIVNVSSTRGRTCWVAASLDQQQQVP